MLHENIERLDGKTNFASSMTQLQSRSLKFDLLSPSCDKHA